MIALYQVTALISAVAVLLVHAVPQDIATSTSITRSISSPTTSATQSTTTGGGFSLCPVTDAPFQLNFLTCAASPAFDSCSCDANGLAYKLFFSCAFTYVEQRTAEAKTEQSKQDIKAQVQSVVDQFVSGCKNVGMPIEPLDVTSGKPPPVSGGFTFSTATQFGVSATASPNRTATSTTPGTATGTPTGTATGATIAIGTKTGNSGRAVVVRNNGVGFAAVLVLLLFVFN